MYYKLHLKDKKITTISTVVLQDDTKILGNTGYELIFLSDLDAFVKQKIQLPHHSFLVAFNESYSYTLKNALPALIDENISLIIFLPVLIANNSNNYQDKEVQQLNDFIFSAEFKNIFSYTQPICQTSTTI
ncbi:MAG: hypothetical protein ACKVOW_07795 [Chitinophagaceae bacterium]